MSWLEFVNYSVPEPYSHPTKKICIILLRYIDAHEDVVETQTNILQA